MANMKVRISSFAESYETSLPLIKEHWNEVPFGPWNDIELEINTEVYLLLEKQGMLRVVVAEDDGEMVGYLIIICGEMNHHKSLWKASTDVIYVDTKYRKTGLGADMIKLAMEDCKDHGVSFLSVSVNTNLDFSKMLEANGALLTEKQYTWRL